MYTFSIYFNWLGSFLCFLPIFLDWEYNILGYDNYNVLPIHSALNSKEFEFSLVAGISIAIPLICELGTDTLMTKMTISSRLTSHQHIVFSKWVLLLILLIPNVLPANHFVYAPILSTSRQILLFHVLGSFMSSYGSPIWNSKVTGFMTSLYTISKLLECYSSFAPMSSEYISLIKVVFFCIVSLLLFSTVCRWIFHIKTRWFDERQELTLDEYYCNVHLLALLIGFLGSWCLFFVFSHDTWANPSALNLSLFNYLEIGYTVIISIWTGRIARREIAVLQSKHELETKRMFVRYVSHEIRTPLNTVGMGLQLLRAELAKIRDNEAMLDIVQDLSVSCDTAVDILNDLLTYEKLTANILQLDSAVISVKKFVSEVVRPFFMQARQAGIELSIAFGGDLLDEGVDVNIFGDKSKLSQVVRNLVSNALKFSKRDGRVTISVSHCTEDISGSSVAVMGTLSRALRSANSAYRSVRSKSYRLKSSEKVHIVDENAVIGSRSEVEVAIGGRKQDRAPDDESSRTGSGVSGKMEDRLLDASNAGVLSGRSIPPVSRDDLFGDSGEEMTGRRSWLKIAVTDSGVGISEENQKRLFKEIVQFNPGELQDGKGSGLGLWISSRIMELHGGDLTVFSEGIGHGCTFTMSVPMKELVGVNAQQVNPTNDSDPGKMFSQNTVQAHITPLASVLDGSRVGAVGSCLIMEESKGDEHRRDCDRGVVCSNQCVTSNHHILSRKSKNLSASHLSAHSRSNSADTLSALALSMTNAVQTVMRGSTLIRKSSAGRVLSAKVAHILLVDDAPMNRKMLNRLLKDRCGTISEAEDGKQALDMVLATLRDPSRPAIDVVIMDNLMPVMDGPTAVREMRSAGYRGIVIGLTGNALPADIQWFLSHGADRVMIKPCNMEELDGILRELLVKRLAHEN